MPKTFALFNFSDNFVISIKPVERLISTKSILAPQYNPALAEATKVIGEVHNQSPFPRPRDWQAICNALVALLNETQYSELVCMAIFCSKLIDVGP